MRSRDRTTVVPSTKRETIKNLLTNPHRQPAVFYSRGYASGLKSFL